MKRFMLRLIGLALLIALTVGKGTTPAAWATATADAVTPGLQRAGLVVRYADGSVQTACVTFAEPTISGLELLQRAGFTLTVNYNAGLGGAVCSLNGTGCSYPAQDCFCRCQGAACEYWAYYHRTANGWNYSAVGASSFVVRDGALEGWSWGPGNFAQGTEPPLLSFETVCPPVASSPADAAGRASEAAAALQSRSFPWPSAGTGSLANYAAYLLLALAILAAGGWAWTRQRYGN